MIELPSRIGPYEVLRRHSAGGMAELFLARDAAGREVMLKRVLPAYAASTDFIRMFLDEARIAARLHHPNIVGVLDLLSIEETLVIALEYVRGDDLGRLLHRSRRHVKPVPVPVACAIVAAAAAGLAYAHGRRGDDGTPLGIVHRDVSPQNVLVSAEGEVKLTDFGIAKAADRFTRTRIGEVKGKCSYMSPEQATGREVDHRTDLFALGAVLHELLTGVRLFRGRCDADILASVAACDVSPPSSSRGELSRVLDAICLKALARDPRDRYPDCAAFGQELERYLAARGASAGPAQVARFLRELVDDPAELGSGEPPPPPGTLATRAEGDSGRRRLLSGEGSVRRGVPADDALARERAVTSPSVAVPAPTQQLRVPESARQVVDAANRFLVEELLESGGMGTVYRARDQLTGQPVALKVLLGTGAADRERFEREAALLADLVHPGIVRYVAHGLTAAGQPFLAMEWLPGADLASALSREHLPLAHAVGMTIAVADALAVLHGRGVVHRDVKPQNVFLVDGDPLRPKLLDLGIARAPLSGPLTRTGTTLGTPAYMAPEQARGARDLGPRADVFALGCVLMEALTGRPPFVGDNFVAVLAKVLLEEPPRLKDALPDAPAALDELVGRMLSKDPALRPADGAAVAAQLRTLEVVAAPPRPVPQRRQREKALTDSERRLISVLLAGEPPGAKLDAEALARVRETVAAHGGALEVLAGGELLASLAGGGSMIDQAAAAARCALALRAQLPGSPMVLATGGATVSTRGGSAGLPVGDVLDRVAAALPTAPAGGIRLDESTAGLLDARFEVRGEGDVLYLAGERDEAEPARTVLGERTPCVGRDRELHLLDGLLAECVEEPVARVAFVGGAAGMGKSRLRYELAARARERGPIEILVGRGSSVKAGTPFGLLSSALQRTAGVLEGEDPVVRRRKLRGRLSRRVGSARLQHITPFLAEAIGAPFPEDATEALRAARADPLQMADSIGAALQEWLAAECEAQPVMLVLEDLQWGDLPSVGVVDAVLRNLCDRPLFVLALGRPEALARFPGLWAERELQSITLGALARKAAEALVRRVLGAGAAEADVARIVERAEGNPFYLEELLRAGPGLSGKQLPDSIVGTVQARLDALGPAARRVLRAASVFGRRFTREGAAALLAEDERTGVGETLDELARREFTNRRGPAALPGDVEHAFRHELIRDAAYALLTDEDRALGHRLAAAWLERTGAGETLDVAGHFVLGREPHRAIPFFRRSAQQALDASDFGAAVERAEQGSACGAVGEARGALRLIQAEAFTFRNQAELIGPALEAMALLPRGSAGWFRAVTLTGYRSNTPEDLARLRSTYEQTLATEPLAGAEPAQLQCLSVSVNLLHHAGCLDLLQRVLAELDRLAANPLAHKMPASAHYRRARAYWRARCGDTSQAIDELAEALDALERAGFARDACNVLCTSAFFRSELGDYDRASVEYRRALVQCERLDLRNLVAVCHTNLTNIQRRAGELEAAADHGRLALRLSAALDDHRFLGAAHVHRAAIELEEGELAAAEASARRGAELLAQHPGLQAMADAMLARALVARGRAEEAVAAVARAEAVYRRLGLLEMGEPLFLWARVEARNAAGDSAGARAALEEARARTLERATRIGRSELRTSFLEAVAENASILALARSWGIGEA